MVLLGYSIHQRSCRRLIAGVERFEFALVTLLSSKVGTAMAPDNSFEGLSTECRVALYQR